MEQDRRWNWPKLFYQMWQNCPDWQTPFSSSPHFLECIPKTWTFARIWRCTQYILSVRHYQDISELLKQRCLWVTDTNQKWGLFHPSYKIKAMMLPHLTSINFLKELVERVMMKVHSLTVFSLNYVLIIVRRKWFTVTTITSTCIHQEDLKEEISSG